MTQLTENEHQIVVQWKKWCAAAYWKKWCSATVFDHGDPDDNLANAPHVLGQLLAIIDRLQE